ncbi:MAG: PQQ-binding-like beta-propeller repeat protein [Alphaproteobacteria bacterium]
MGLLVLLSACDSWLGGKREPPLPGKRISVMAFDRLLEPDQQLADLAVRLPKPFVNADWPQAGGYPNHAMHHLSADGPLRRVWRVDIGDGSGSTAQLLSAPVVADGVVYTIDARAEVRAFNASTGNRLWRRRLTSEHEDDSFGGGLAFAGGRLFVTTGFAQVIALEAATGKEIWRVRVGGPIRAAPTVFRGRIFVTTIANELVALDAKDGKVKWNHVGITETAGLLGGAAPTADGSVVMAAYSSGEIVALRIENGRVIWSDSLTALRRSNPVSTIAHVRGRPVIDRGQVLVTANSGRTVAIDLRTGARLWERAIGSAYGPWVAGAYVYLISNDGLIVCLIRKTGGVRWVRQLQRFEDEEDQEGPIFWSGLVLAGDRLLLGGSHGELLSVSPYTGNLLGRVDISDKVFIAPVVAGNTVYVLTDGGRLIALR